MTHLRLLLLALFTAASGLLGCDDASSPLGTTSAENVAGDPAAGSAAAEAPATDLAAAGKPGAELGTSIQPQAVISSFENIRVRGTLANGGSFRGLLDIVRFVVQGDQIYAIGRLSGRLFDAHGNLIGRVQDVRVRLPLTDIEGTCEILHLELGPLHLDLLGLVVDLNRVVLDITAEAGEGNLLGNLLCAIARLLDDPDLDLDRLVRLLNRVVAVLG